MRPLFSGRSAIWKARAKMCRENEKPCLCVIARREATKQSSLRFVSLDCFASLAMTVRLIPKPLRCPRVQTARDRRFLAAALGGDVEAGDFGIGDQRGKI